MSQASLLRRTGGVTNLFWSGTGFQPAAMVPSRSTPVVKVRVKVRVTLRSGLRLQLGSGFGLGLSWDLGLGLGLGLGFGCWVSLGLGCDSTPGWRVTSDVSDEPCVVGDGNEC